MMRGTITCPMCPWQRDDELDQLAARYLVHFIDDHWDLVERVHATTGDPEARMTLNIQLAHEIETRTL